MKKTISIIYRLAFLIFGTWAILDNVSYNILFLPNSLKNFAVFNVFLFLICIGVIFWASLKNRKIKWLSYLKGTLTLLAWFMIIINFKILFHSVNIYWILNVLLPVMLIIDRILFDTKGKIKTQDFLSWLAGFLFLCFGIPWLLDIVFGINGLSFLYNGSITEILKYLPHILGAGALMFLTDTLFSLGNQKNTSGLMKLLFRMLFIVIEVYSFYKLSNTNVSIFLRSLLEYTPLVNFLCLLCITVLVLLTFFNSGTKADAIYTRLKALFTIAISATLLMQIFVIKDYAHMSDVHIIHYILAPSMMLIDLILFDNKHSYKWYDPAIWISLPVVYSIINVLFKLSAQLSAVSLLGGFGLLLCIGYAFFLLGKLK